jgi:hypothetical protein
LINRACINPINARPKKLLDRCNAPNNVLHPDLNNLSEQSSPYSHARPDTTETRSSSDLFFNGIALSSCANAQKALRSKSGAIMSQHILQKQLSSAGINQLTRSLILSDISEELDLIKDHRQAAAAGVKTIDSRDTKYLGINPDRSKATVFCQGGLCLPIN